jgi:hypothetical protein
MTDNREKWWTKSTLWATNDNGMSVNMTWQHGRRKGGQKSHREGHEAKEEKKKIWQQENDNMNWNERGENIVQYLTETLRVRCAAFSVRQIVAMARLRFMPIVPFSAYPSSSALYLTQTAPELEHGTGGRPEIETRDI